MINLLITSAVILLVVGFGELFCIGTRVLISGIKYNGDLGDVVFGLMIMISSLVACYGMLTLVF